MWNAFPGQYIPLSQLLPVHSIVQLAIMRVLLPGPHIRQYFVFVVKILPLGTSGVCVLQLTVTAFSKSNASSVLVVMHFVCFGPTGPFRGLMYEKVKDL
jgi:hypothetical protein